MRIKAKVFIPRDMVFKPERIMRAVQNSLDDAATAIQADFQVTTQTWEKRPEFIITRPDLFTREIFTESEIYAYVNDGTRPHPIVARYAPRLAFYRTGFRPKTVVRAIRSNQGRKADANFIRPIAVMHPGNEGREFTEVIAEKWTNQFPVILQRAIDSELRVISDGVIIWE